MTRIDHIHSLLHSLRPLTDRVRKSDLGKTLSQKRDIKNSSTKISEIELKKIITNRINHYKEHAGHNWQTAEAIGIFIETALVWEFGEDLTNSSDMRELLEAVKKSCAENKVLLSEFEKFFAE
jgi:hypothetical protein